MTSNDFNLLMNTECSRCQQAVKFHRITPTGTSYCLEFNRKSSHRPVHGRSGSDMAWRERLAYRVKVNELVRSPLPQSIGTLINSELHVLIKEDV